MACPLLFVESMTGLFYVTVKKPFIAITLDNGCPVLGGAYLHCRANEIDMDW